MVYTYDGTWHGLLTVVFETYRLKAPATQIAMDELYQPSFFDKPLHIATDEEKAKRVVKGLVKRTGQKGHRLLYRCFLSEQVGIEMLIYYFIQKSIEIEHNILENYRDDKILQLHQINKKIGREVHRMHAFVRFQETKDGMLVALINPDFNVLPLTGKHFVERYPALEWLIYDTKRHYGWYYSQHKSSFITLSENKHNYISSQLLTGDELDYQDLWQSYFKATDIPERRNMKLHLQHVPKRYWKFLVEKV